MNHAAGALENGGTGLERADIRLQEMQPRIVLVMREVDLAPTDQIVDHPDFVAAVEQEIDHVTANETGAAGDNSDLVAAHATSTVFMF